MSEDIRDEVAKELAIPPKKRSLFSKPTWSKPTGPEEAIEFFSRAKELYPIRVAEEERKRKKKLVKLERTAATVNVERSGSSPDGKRRRKSSPSEELERHSSGSPPCHDQHKEASWARRDPTQASPPNYESSSSLDQPKYHKSPTSLSGHCSEDLHVEKQELHKSGEATKGYTSLSDSEGEGLCEGWTAKESVYNPVGLKDNCPNTFSKPRKQTVEDDLQLSDEEFPELVQKAREREKQKALEHFSARKAYVEKDYNFRRGEASFESVDDIFQEQSSSTSELDPTIEIFVSSWIEGTKPLMVRRKLSQRLKEVRLSWSDRQLIDGQPLRTDVRAAIFLTWRGKRLFDVTTCRGLGLKIDVNGRLHSDGDGFDENGRIHLEAWTEELFADFRKKLESKRLQEHSETDESDKRKEEAVPKIKLLMKARDLEPFKIVVKPATLIEKMVGAFRRSRNVSKEKDVALYFDGDRLDPGSKIEETELGDMDTVEVHVR